MNQILVSEGKYIFTIFFSSLIGEKHFCLNQRAKIVLDETCL